MNPEQAKQFLQENDVKFVLAQFVDIHGVAKTKSANNVKSNKKK